MGLALLLLALVPLAFMPDFVGGATDGSDGADDGGLPGDAGTVGDDGFGQPDLLNPSGQDATTGSDPAAGAGSFFGYGAGLGTGLGGAGADASDPGPGGAGPGGAADPLLPVDPTLPDTAWNPDDGMPDPDDILAPVIEDDAAHTGGGDPLGDGSADAGADAGAAGDADADAAGSADAGADADAAGDGVSDDSGAGDDGAHDGNDGSNDARGDGDGLEDGGRDGDDRHGDDRHDDDSHDDDSHDDDRKDNDRHDDDDAAIQPLLPVDDIDSNADTIWLNLNEDHGIGYAEISDFVPGSDMLEISVDSHDGHDAPEISVGPSDDGQDGMVYVDDDLVAVLHGAPGVSLDDISIVPGLSGD